MSGGVGCTSLVLLVLVLGYTVWLGDDGSVFPGAEATPSKTSLCDKLPGWCEKQAVVPSDRPRNKIQDKMAETKWRKKRDGGMGNTERGKSKTVDKHWLRGVAAPRPSRRSEDWKSRLKTELFHDDEEEDIWEVDDEDYLKVEDESEEEETVEEETEEDYEEEDDEEDDEKDDEEEDEEEEEEEDEEEDEDSEEDEEDDEEVEEESEEEFEEEEDEDVSEIAGMFKKRWGFDEEQEEDDSEEIIRKAKIEEDKKKLEEEAKRRKVELEQAKKDAELKKKALQQQARKKINEELKKKVEEERRKKKDKEEKKQREEAEARKKIEEGRKKLEEENKRREETKKKELEEERKRKEEDKRMELEEEKRRKINEERKRKIEEEWKKREEEKRLREAEEERKRQEELKREEEKRKEEDEKRRKINEERRKRVEEEKLKKEAEEKLRKEAEEKLKKEAEEKRRQEEEEEKRQRVLEEKKKKEEEEERIRQEKEEAKKKMEEERRRKEEERRRKEEEEAERKRAEEEKRKEEERQKKEEARKEAERIKREEEKRKREQEEKKRNDEEKRRKEEEERRKEAERKREEEEAKKKEEEKKKKEEEEKTRLEEEEKRKDEKEKRKKEEEKQKQKEEEETKKRVKERLANEEKKKKDQAEKAKQKAVEDAKIEKAKEEMPVKEQTDSKKERGDKQAPKEEDAKPTKSKTKSKRKAEKIPTSVWSPDFPEFFAPTANDEVQNEECKKQSRIYVQHLRRLRTWALQMYDATAKLPSGILSGNVNQFGDFDECLAVDVHLRARGSTATADTSPAPEPSPEDNGTSVGGLAGFLQRVLSWGAALVKAARGAPGSEVVHIRGRYCLASVDVDVLPDPRRSRADHAALHDAVQRALSYRFLRGSINDTQHFVPRFSTVSWALCVPAVCSARDVEDGLLASIKNWEIGDDNWGSGKVRLQLAIPDDACRTAPQQPAHKRLPPSFYFVIGSLAILALLALVATLKDQGEADEDMAPERRMLIAFSLRRSWAVLSAPDDVGTADIHCMHGLRAVCSLALYMAHKVIPAASAPYSNRGKLTQAALSPLSLLLRSSVVYTDTFLLLSGALSSFHFSRELSRTGSLAWRDRYVARLFRLTPPLLVVLLYYSFVMEHIGNGPRWGPLVEANARLCRKNMWRNLLYIQNFFPFKEMCAPQTHQLALDVQLSLLSAPLVWFLNYSPLLASPLIVILQAVSAWLRHRTALQHRVALLIYHGQKPSELYRAADLSYALAPHRATAYLVGIALGYTLHQIKKPLKLPKLIVIIGWIASAASASWAIFGLRGAATKDFKFDAHQVAVFNAFAPLAWAVAISWVVLACHADFGGILGRILSSRVLLLLSRISYAFYLTQFIVFFHNAGSARSQAEFSILGVLDLWELVTVLAVSTIFTLLIDLPVQAVRAAFHHKAEPREKNNTHVRRSKKWDGNNELTWREKEE